MNEDLVLEGQAERIEMVPGTSSTGVRAFDNTIQKSNIWLNDVNLKLNLGDKNRAYSILRAVLHSLRDVMNTTSVVNLGAQLPMLIRGFFFEGWEVEQKYKCHSKEDFYWLVSNHFSQDGFDTLSVETAVRGVMAVLAQHVGPGEVLKIKAVLHGQLKDLIDTDLM